VFIPSSHVSPNWPSTALSPQYGAGVHWLVHRFIPYAVALFAAPWSQPSGGFCCVPSPQYAASVQLAVPGPYLPSFLPLSPCSVPFLMPSPQRGPSEQSGLHLPSPPVLFAAPLSHCSPCWSMPSPQCSLQSAWHLSPVAPLLIPSSHSSPLVDCT